MKAGDLSKLLAGVDPEAKVYIDLGVCHNKIEALAKDMLLTDDSGCADIEDIEMSVFEEGVKEVYLIPYDGQYILDNEEAKNFFIRHGIYDEE